MTIIKSREFGIEPNEDITKKLIELSNYLKTIDGQKRVIFEKGEYYIDSEKCDVHTLFITNTVGDNEFSKDEKPHENAVAFYFKDTNDVEFDGGNSIFKINGKVTNIAMENCKNITLKNMEIRHIRPDMHELKVIGKTLFGVDFEIDRDTEYKFDNGKLYFYGNDWYCDAAKNAQTARWIGLVRKNSLQKIERVAHPLMSALKIEDLGNRKIRVLYPNTFRFKIGDCFYIYDVRRQFAGIFANKCENLVLENIAQRFNYSLALVVQDSENVKVDKICFAPEKDSARKMASVADFVQLCMCRGDISIRNSYFEGAGDDCLNVHGVHFKITQVSGNTITVRFMHPQTHGFNPLRAGDKIAYIDTETLLETGTDIIEKSELLNEYDIRLTVSDTSKATKGNVIEDISAYPNLDFENNTISRIITRALLITTRGKVNIFGNRFISNTMSGILLSDDAKNWFESGMCTDVNIESNVFDFCGQTPILIKPENRVHAGAVHRNIKIKNNTFKKYDGFCINAKSCDNILIEGNNFISKKIIKSKNCNNIISE